MLTQCRLSLFGFPRQVVNVTAGVAEERMLTTGLDTVADIHCNICRVTVGWTYVRQYVDQVFVFFFVLVGSQRASPPPKKNLNLSLAGSRRYREHSTRPTRTTRSTRFVDFGEA